MLAGIFTATLTNTAEALNVVESAGVVTPSASFARSALSFAMFSLVALLLPGFLSKAQSSLN